MRKIKFVKMVASGNDFVITENREPMVRLRSPSALSEVEVPRTENRILSNFARKICDRIYGIGADGLLVLEKSRVTDVKMRIFNADGSEAQMCGNGARCVALYTENREPTCPERRSSTSLRQSRGRTENRITIETKAGIIVSQVNKDNVKIKLTKPKDIKLDIPIKVNNRRLEVNYIDTGVPHVVIFLNSLDKIDIKGIGRQIRFNKKFSPGGTNVDFVKVLNKSKIALRTYERGVEDETFACGTGAVASSLLFAIRYSLFAIKRINVLTKSGEILKVYFERTNKHFRNVWLEGKAKIVFTGVYNV